uniref:Methyltransferase domain-containing protein n=1 Tax=Entomoneis paludosa TaxID=265537 RepID=A0A7S2YDD7_9STRA
MTIIKRRRKSNSSPLSFFLLPVAAVGIVLLGAAYDIGYRKGGQTKEEHRRADETPDNASGLRITALPSSKVTNGNDRDLGLSAKRALNLPPKSLHPDWKLWEEMNESEGDIAFARAGTYLTKYGKLISDKKTKTHGTCPAVKFGGHMLCGPPPEPDNCVFFSFGINDDPSLDQELAETWKCRGFAGDPTVHHPSKLHPKVSFHNIGASTLSANEERLINKGGNEEWWETSMPKLKDFLNLDHVDIIKLDCEGCEVALARDILVEDPTFLHHVDQMSIETHVTKTWVSTKEQIYYFGMHFALLEEAGFVLEWSNIFGCSKRHEVAGCMEELVETGFPCGYRPWPNHPNVVLGRSCQDFLWKRYPDKAPGAVVV